MRETVAQAFGHVRGAMERGAASRGRNNMISYVSGNRLTARQAIVAKCADCCAYHIDGRRDCECYACPLYPYMPYGRFRKRYVRKPKEGQNDNP